MKKFLFDSSVKPALVIYSIMIFHVQDGYLYRLPLRVQCYQILSHRKKHGRFRDNAQTERTMRVRAGAGAQARARQGGRAGELQVSTKAEETDDGRERSGMPTPRTDGSSARARILPQHGRRRSVGGWAERAASPSSSIHGCARNSFT